MYGKQARWCSLGAAFLWGWSLLAPAAQAEEISLPSGLTALTAQGVLDQGERIAFLGDSITQAGDAPGGYVDRIRTCLQEQAAAAEATIIPAGISGNRVPDLLARLDRDILAHKPTVVFIYIGINDVWHSQNGRGTPADEFEAGLNELLDRIAGAGALAILATPSVIGEKTDGGNPLDGMLEDYAAISRRVAGGRGLQICDLRADFLIWLKANNPENKESGLLTSDTVHLNEAGNTFVAERAAAAIAEALARRNEMRTEASDGFTSLFDGQSWEEHWQLVDGAGPGYVAENNLLVCPAAGGGRLFTKEEYANFVFRFEYRLQAGGNNGVGIRSPLEGDPAYVAMELQILDNDAPEYATLQPYQYHGSIYGVVAAPRGATKPAGQWNRQEVLCDGRHVRVTLNGQVIVDANLDDVTDPETLRVHPGLARTTGHIGFLGHGTTVEFRHLRVKRLP